MKLGFGNLKLREKLGMKTEKEKGTDLKVEIENGDIVVVWFTTTSTTLLPSDSVMFSKQQNLQISTILFNPMFFFFFLINFNPIFLRGYISLIDKLDVIINKSK